ncbi:MAG: hypothetical protein RLZZ214_175 [Verrucomicrobiota bacterium]|jgi:hypothetical protein
MIELTDIGWTSYFAARAKECDGKLRVVCQFGRLEFVKEHNECLVSLSNCLDVGYSKSDLAAKIKTFKG